MYVFFFALLFDVIHRLLLLICVSVINLFRNNIILLHQSLHQFFKKLYYLILYLFFHLLDLLILLSTSLTYLVKYGTIIFTNIQYLLLLSSIIIYIILIVQKLLNLNHCLFLNYVVVVFISFVLNLVLLMYLLNFIIVQFVSNT